MSITNRLISSRSTCQIYTLRVAYSICSVLLSFFPKSPYDNTGVERLVKREKCWQTQPREWWREREKKGGREASCYEIPLWCFRTTWDEKSGLSSPVFERHMNEKSPSLKLLKIWWMKKSVVDFLQAKINAQLFPSSTSSAFQSYISRNTWFIHNVKH